MTHHSYTTSLSRLVSTHPHACALSRLASTHPRATGCIRYGTCCISTSPKFPPALAQVHLPPPPPTLTHVRKHIECHPAAQCTRTNQLAVPATSCHCRILRQNPKRWNVVPITLRRTAYTHKLTTGLHVVLNMQTGIDVIFLDTEHVPIPIDTLSWMCRTFTGLGIPAICRVPEPEPYKITEYLDAGAVGIVAPYLETVDEVKMMIGSVKLRPLKVRAPATCIRTPPVCLPVYGRVLRLSSLP